MTFFKRANFLQWTVPSLLLALGSVVWVFGHEDYTKLSPHTVLDAKLGPCAVQLSLEVLTTHHKLTPVALFDIQDACSEMHREGLADLSRPLEPLFLLEEHEVLTQQKSLVSALLQYAFTYEEWRAVTTRSAMPPDAWGQARVNFQAYHRTYWKTQLAQDSDARLALDNQRDAFNRALGLDLRLPASQRSVMH